MAFQLVHATDSEITVWHTDLGHIYKFAVDAPRRDLVAQWTRDVPEAVQRADTLLGDAHRFAAHEARIRQLIR